jgi:hypothetical protein
LSVLLLLVACAVPGTEVSPTVTLAPTLTQTPTPSASPTIAPSATSTPTKRPTRRPTITLAPTRTPVPPTATATSAPVNWMVNWPVAELSSNDLNLQPWQETWLDGNSLLMSQDGGDYRIQITNEQVSEPLLLPVPTPLFAYPSSVSPAENFAAECQPERLNLYRLPSRQMIGQFETIVQHCQTIRWRNDETALSFTSQGGKVFIWEIALPNPREVGVGLSWAPASWSPDQAKILVLEPYQNYADEVTFNIIFLDGNPELKTGAELPAGNNWYPEYVHWVSDGIVGNFVWGNSYQYYWYHDALTGEIIIEYGIEGFPDGRSDNQQALVSPDRQWIIFDQLIASPDRVYSKYLLLNTFTKEISTILEEKETQLAFVGWSEDSSRFYTISRPLTETSQPSLPTGLLALDPNTRQFTPLIPDALYATLNPQQTHAFTLLPENDHLTPALYTLSGDLLIAFQPVTDDLPYLSPEALTPGEGFPIPAAWSNDGTQIIFSDVWGALWLADASGAVTQLADNLGFDPAYPRQPRFSWSPDDSHLLITFDDRAWVVTVR